MATIDVTSTDIFEIARTQGGGDPIDIGNGNLAVQMRDDFQMHVEHFGVSTHEAGEYLICNNQRMIRFTLSAESFAILFGGVRQ